MGQTRPVTVFKYIMEGSVEQVTHPPFSTSKCANSQKSIVKLQERKTRIIKLSMQDKDANESDANLDVRSSPQILDGITNSIQRFKFTLDPNEWKANL